MDDVLGAWPGDTFFSPPWADRDSEFSELLEGVLSRSVLAEWEGEGLGAGSVTLLESPVNQLLKKLSSPWGTGGTSADATSPSDPHKRIVYSMCKGNKYTTEMYTDGLYFSFLVDCASVWIDALVIGYRTNTPTNTRRKRQQLF